MLRCLILFFLISWIFVLPSVAQQKSITKKIKFSTEEIKIDSFSILPSSFQVKYCGQILDSTNYDFEPLYSFLKIKTITKGCDSIEVTYVPLNFQPDKIYTHKEKNKNIPDPNVPSVFNFKPSQLKPDFFLTEGLNKSGSISRGINFGNNQDLSVISALNLELSGKISDDVSILASITDNNIPIQPDGNTQQLQDFDQIYIKVFDKNNALTAGDFWMKKPTGYFMTYNKRSQGAMYSRIIKPDSSLKYATKTEVGLAVSKGKFARNVVQGLEGNQGPYRLRGAENEQFIIVLAGTERVYIDGELLTRGQENDYIIDYNTAEVIFTANQFITKDRRIIIEFQYSDKNYARSIAFGNTEWTNSKNKFFLNFYSEQDAKNQSLQQVLSTEQKDLLSSIGDSLHLAVSNSAQLSEFSSNLVMYKMVDSLGYDSVFVFSVNPDSANFRVTFSYVGENNGDYLVSQFTAIGKTFRWVAPDTVSNVIIHKGNYNPVSLLTTPKQRQMVTGGMEHYFNKKSSIGFEGAYTKFDQNTFSLINNEDDGGYAAKVYLQQELNLQKNAVKDPLKLKGKLNFETVSSTFSQIERFRAVEFERNWNIINTKITGDQYIGEGLLSLNQKKWGNTDYQFTSYFGGEQYTGLLHEIHSNVKQKGFYAKIDGSLLSTSGIYNTSFLRHNSHISQNIGFLKLSFKDIHEWNNYYNPTRDSLKTSSYRFYDYEFNLSQHDTIQNRISAFYRQRFDWKTDSHAKYLRYAVANHYGVGIELLKNRKNQLRAKAAYRDLIIKNDSITTQQPDQNIIGRLEYDLKAVKNVFIWNTFYEIGTGQELKKEFIYIEVPAGQGNYTWIDYNNNGIKELNEFEIATFTDQATYIRTFIPTSDYVKTYTNQFSQSLHIQPSQIWSRKKGVLKFLSRFSNQTAYRVDRKTNNANKSDAYNPLLKDIADTSLLSLSTSLRNSFFFNRTSPIFGADYTFLDNRSKVLLSNGFDSREQIYHQINLRWNITKYFLFQTKTEQGQRGSFSDFLSGRNYLIQYFSVAPKLSYQPNTNFRIGLQYEYSDKKNDADFGNESAFISDIGLEIKYNMTEKGSLLFNFNYVDILFNGNANSSLGFEMLNALKPGKNLTWSSSLQRTINKNMQLNLVYSGRKNESGKIIHNGGLQVRAFF